MTSEIAITLTILAVAILLFVTERLRMDLVALIVMAGLALTGLVTPAEALSGFSNLAVVTVWAVFILSGGLSRTGVANLIGRYLFRLAGKGEIRLLVVIMVTASLLSAFMNSIGVAALLLPVVIDLARRAGRPPSKLLMPLAFAALLGGLNTLIGTPPNILISEALRDAGLEPFTMFDYTPVGVALTLAGIAFIGLIGHRLLPARDIAQEFGVSRAPEPGDFFGLQQGLFTLHLSPSSALVGKTLAESRVGSALDLNVIGVMREGQAELAPSPHHILQANDRLLVVGRLDRLDELRHRQHLVIEDETLAIEGLTSTDIQFAELGLSPRASILGKSLQEINFRQQFGVIVLGLWRDGAPVLYNVDDLPLRLGDTLLVQGPRRQLVALGESPDFLLSSARVADVFQLQEQLLAVRVPPDSTLVGRTLAESRLAEAFGLTVLGVVRGADTHLMPTAKEKLQADDTLLVKGQAESLSALQGLDELQVDLGDAPLLSELESEQVGLVEAVLSPYATLAGKTLRQLHFREKYGLSVLALWRESRAYRSNLRDMALRFGDALLLYGPRERLKVLGSEPDFLVLTEEAQEAPRFNKAPLAILVMAGVLIPVIFGWLPISISAVVGVALMVLTGCLTMDEAYRFIEWKAIFLIAGMLPMGIAMERTGTAKFLAEGMISLVGDSGGLAVVAGLFILSALASQVMPNPAVAVLLAPLALSAAGDMGIPPYPLMMVVALSSSAAFLSPVGHPANVLIMGPGGYRFADYLKVGLPLTLLLLGVTLLVLPIFWPLTP